MERLSFGADVAFTPRDDLLDGVTVATGLVNPAGKKATLSNAQFGDAALPTTPGTSHDKEGGATAAPPVPPLRLPRVRP